MKRFPNKLSFSTQLIVLAANFVILMLKLLELLFSLRQLSLELLYLLFCIMLGYLQRVQLTLQRSESFLGFAASARACAASCRCCWICVSFSALELCRLVDCLFASERSAFSLCILSCKELIVAFVFWSSSYSCPDRVSALVSSVLR